MTDEQLMEEYKLKDNPEAFNTLYGNYSQIVYGYLSKKIFNKTNTDEIFQDIFVKLHQSRNQYDPKFPFKAWLFTIVRSCMYDYFRKIKSAETTKENFQQFILNSFPENVANESVDISHLKAAERDILQKRFVEDWSFEEIAAELKISEAGVRQRISRVVKQLRGKYV